MAGAYTPPKMPWHNHLCLEAFFFYDKEECFPKTEKFSFVNLLIHFSEF